MGVKWSVLFGRWTISKFPLQVTCLVGKVGELLISSKEVAIAKTTRHGKDSEVVVQKYGVEGYHFLLPARNEANKQNLLILVVWEVPFS